MIFRYFPETDSLYVEFEPDQAAETVAVTDSFLIDFDSDSHIVGIDIDKASNHLDLSALDANVLPFRWLTEARTPVMADTGTGHS